MKQKALNALCFLLALACLAVTVIGLRWSAAAAENDYSDGIEQLDLNTIHLRGSRVTVSFSDVILSKQNEERRLIVSTQEATVDTELTSRLIEKLDFDFLKKSQKVSYRGTGYFVVDLDSAHLRESDITADEAAKTVTIRIEHPHLETVDIDPDDVMIDEVHEGLLARGKIRLTVEDFNGIEKELRERLEAAFDTAENINEANDNALRMVAELYEPVVRAVDDRWRVQVVYR